MNYLITSLKDPKFFFFLMEHELAINGEEILSAGFSFGVPCQVRHNEQSYWLLIKMKREGNGQNNSRKSSFSGNFYFSIS